MRQRRDQLDGWSRLAYSKDMTNFEQPKPTYRYTVIINMRDELRVEFETNFAAPTITDGTYTWSGTSFGHVVANKSHVMLTQTLLNETDPNLR